jgi:two-component system phosphate regulon sensor histidine kinase PhoR
LLEEALGNVVDNAVRYNREGGHVAVSLDERPDSGFCLRVLDDGPGIAQSEISRLEERYFRGNAARTRAPGHGLGLNIARQVTRLHDWQLVIAPASGGGLKVDFFGRITLAEESRQA